MLSGFLLFNLSLLQVYQLHAVLQENSRSAQQILLLQIAGTSSSLVLTDMVAWCSSTLK